jgi:transposase
VRIYAEHRGEYASDNAAYRGISEKLGCNADTLRGWVQRASVDAVDRAGLSSAERARMKELERENKELRQANEILRKASAYFAMAELDRPFRK